MSFNVFEARQCVLQYNKTWNDAESHVFEKLTAGPIKGEGIYVHVKLKMWKEHIKTNRHGQNVPYNVYCNATEVLKIDSVYCKYTNGKNRQCKILSDDEIDS